MTAALQFQFINTISAEPAVTLPDKSCQWSECDLHGEFKAPLDHQDLQKMGWFCLKHIRLYNRAWNYYAGMTEAEVEADRRGDTVWQRSTWAINSDHDKNGVQFQAGGPTFADPFSFFNDGGASARPSSDRDDEMRRPTLSTTQEKAFKIFGLDLFANEAAIKRRYKELVKRHHPDANLGDPNSEETIKCINEAYQNILAYLTAT